MRALAAFWLGALFFFLSATGCIPYPQRPVVDEVEIEPGDAVDVDTILEHLATVETPRLFGIFPRVLEYETYDPNVLARDLERVERAYRSRGYYEAKVTAARVVHVDEHHVRVEIRVYEGQPVRVAKFPDTPGLGSMPIEHQEASKAATLGIQTKRGDIFDEARFEGDKTRIRNALRAHGFAFAKVEGRATVDVAKHLAHVTYLIEPGLPATYGPINIVGLREIPEGPVRDALGLEEKKPYARTEVDDAERALIGLGVFARVEIREDLQHPEGAVVPLTVVVEEANLRTIRLGGGTRLDELRLSFGLRAAWENRNFLGGMRHLSLEAKPGVALFPTRIGRFERPIRLLPQFRLRSEFRQPSFLEGRTTGFINGEYAVFPVLYPLDPDLDRAELKKNEPVLGYHAVTAETGVERRFLMHELLVRPSYHWQANFPFYYRAEPDTNFLIPIYVSVPELLMRYTHAFDVGRASKLRVSLSNSLEVAGYVFGGTVSDIKLRPEVHTILDRVFGPRTQVGARLGFGFLFPHNYGQYFDTTVDAQPPNDPTARNTVLDQQKMLFRAFYSGGPTSNRGYPFRGVGPQGPVGFLLPTEATGVNCSGSLTDDERALCVRPIGGMTLWEFTFETRFPLAGPFGGVVFVDASDVTPYRLGSNNALRLDVPHISPGIGLRYETPVGPLRLDVAYRVPGLQEIGSKTLSPQYGSPSGAADENFLNNYYLPLSLNFAIGESFD